MVQRTGKIKKAGRPKKDKAAFGLRLSEVVNEQYPDNTALLFDRLADKGTPVKPPALSNYMSGERIPQSKELQLNMALVLDVAHKWLFEGIGDRKPKQDPRKDYRIPHIEDAVHMSLVHLMKVSASRDRFYYPEKQHSKDAFAVTVRDIENFPHLMPAGGRYYDVVVIDPKIRRANGDFVYIEFQEGSTFRRTFREFHRLPNGLIQLTAKNEEFQSYTIDDIKMSHFEVVGPVVEWRRFS